MTPESNAERPTGTRHNARTNASAKTGFPSVQGSGHPVWQTEYTDLRDTGDNGMGSALTIAAHLHADLVQGNVSAWHHWQFVAAPPYPHSGLMDGKGLTRRAWVIGNWSRFVRPGFLRVEATPSPQAVASVSALSAPATSRPVIVLINTQAFDLTQGVSPANGKSPATFTVWTAPDALALKQSGRVAVAPNGPFTVTLPARSVATLVCDLLGTTPAPSPGPRSRRAAASNPMQAVPPLQNFVRV